MNRTMVLISKHLQEKGWDVRVIEPDRCCISVRGYPYKDMSLLINRHKIYAVGYTADNCLNDPAEGVSKACGAVACGAVFDLHEPDSISQIENKLRWCQEDVDQCLHCKYSHWF